MLHIIESPEGFRLFQPPEDAFDELIQTLNHTEAANEAYIASHSLPQACKPITGTFVFAHAPDYPANTLNDSTQAWGERLAPLCDKGIDTIIFQAAAWKELEECYYASSFMKHFRQWNVMEHTLAAASKLNLRVFLGECGAVTAWQDNGGPEVFNQEIEWHQQCLAELHRQFAGAYHGYYFTSESGYHNVRNPEREALMARVYDRTFSYARSLEALPILISPASFYHPNQRDTMVQFWKSVFSLAKPDIIAPQDSVGCRCTTLEQQPQMYADWASTAQALGCALWANVELFQVAFPAPGRSALSPASPARIAFQCQAASEATEKLICWEALSFPIH